jgi:hypothetical protein
LPCAIGSCIEDHELGAGDAADIMSAVVRDGVMDDSIPRRF